MILSIAIITAVLTVADRSITCVLAKPPDAYVTLQTKNFDLKLDRDSQLLVSLRPRGQSFDFLPFDLISARSGSGFYHWGDITLRYQGSQKTWTSGDSSTNRRKVVTLPGQSANSLLAANLSPTLPTAIVSSLNITREWSELEGDLVLQFTIVNNAARPLELGSLGFPAEFNSIFTNRSPEETQSKCSLADPYIGLHAGFIRTVPVSGVGPALVVTAMAETQFEAYRNLNEKVVEATQYGSQTFEGFYEWQGFTKAWATNEWSEAEPWNTPTSRLIQPGESCKFGVRFSIARDGLRDIENTVRKVGIPTVRGIPGYILPRDLPAQLVLSLPPNLTVKSTSVEPDGAISIQQTAHDVYQVIPSSTFFGRAKLTLRYSDARLQTVHYNIKKSAPEAIADLGRFLTTQQYFTNTSDPFGRAPSVITYDYQAKQIVAQDDRVWIAGLSDEAGAGSFLAAAMKQVIQPSAEEISRLESFIDQVLWGRIQNADHTVKKSIFFYEPSAVPGYEYSRELTWTGWPSWNKTQAYGTSRAYDYVHVAATYWAMYRAARAYPDLFKLHTWDWYLNQSFGTVKACMSGNPSILYSKLGLMGETVFGEILKDLGRENLTENARAFQGWMKTRAAAWNNEAVPFGSEMSWDSTGQEGVYYWSKYFGFNATADKALNTVLGFMPTVPHWGWNGNARRYWDNQYGGKIRRIERQIHHYGSALNALVALAAFRNNSSDAYLLRIGYGGMNGPLSNINSDGFASASFHSWPQTLAWDPYSGDFGSGFVGLVLASATYIVQDADLGITAYGGVVTLGNERVSVEPKDAARRRIFVGPLGVLISVDACEIARLDYSLKDGISLSLIQRERMPQASSTILWIEREVGPANYIISLPKDVKRSRGGWNIPLDGNLTVVLINSASRLQIIQESNRS